MAIASFIIASLVAIAVIYREFIHDWFFGPKLEVAFSLNEPISRVTTLARPLGTLEPSQWMMAFWPRLRVENVGRSVARSCEGILAEVRHPNGKLNKRYDPLTLRWDVVPIDRGFEPLDIARNRVVNLTTFFTTENDSKAHFETHPDATGALLDLEPGHHWLRIVIYGDNFKPVERGYAVHWDGNDYKGVDMQEMNEKPSSTSHWPWPME